MKRPRKPKAPAKPPKPKRVNVAKLHVQFGPTRAAPGSRLRPTKKGK